MKPYKIPTEHPELASIIAYGLIIWFGLVVLGIAFFRGKK